MKAIWNNLIVSGRFAGGLAVFAAFFFAAACDQIEQPKTEPFVSVTKPPRLQEFRWSNGKLPRSFDPAKASAPPETDIVRAIYEGLTELDPRTLEERPAVAEKWTSSEDERTWTFHLRSTARWSNGDPVTSEDFVRSWKRLADLGQKAAHHELLDNFAGIPADRAKPMTAAEEAVEMLLNSTAAERQPKPVAVETPSPVQDIPSHERNAIPGAGVPQPTPTLSVFAENEHTLKVILKQPDKDLPKLLAHPIFRPTHQDEPAAEDDAGAVPPSVTNGAFRITNVGPEGILLGRSETYWNHSAVKLSSVRFVPKPNAEAALEAYRAGELDAVTNAAVAPLAQKLLAPYDDFKKTAHAALNFYEINTAQYPFNDRRVRVALSAAIERERLTEGELEGSTKPARGFLPFETRPDGELLQDRDKARELLEEAGFPDGLHFPIIRLVINRNETQQRVAKLVAQMWKQNLNLDTEIIVKDLSELNAARQSGDFDLIRRGVVFPAPDSAAAFSSIFGSSQAVDDAPVVVIGNPELRSANPLLPDATPTPAAEAPEKRPQQITQERALYEMKAIPLYFPASYALVKPYVSGFDMNSIDAPLLSQVAIDNDWQLK